jgi:dihydrofolate reductase
MKKLGLVVARTATGVIGKDGGLPWRLPEDLKRFREITLGHHVIMGLKTFQSIGRPLPGRHNIVVSTSSGPIDGVTVVGSLAGAFQAVPADEVAFIIGGARMYMEALPYVDEVHLTTVPVEVDGDTWFAASLDDFTVEVEETYSTHTYQVLRRGA